MTAWPARLEQRFSFIHVFRFDPAQQALTLTLPHRSSEGQTTATVTGIQDLQFSVLDANELPDLPWDVLRFRIQAPGRLLVVTTAYEVTLTFDQFMLTDSTSSGAAPIRSAASHATS